ncbi:hypothetical protein DL93DRAFT_196297 [Clavulina sp. PMI_390]|nr:hypothetical protein DL93DRAFT_196297 [Clavulina sp. PMI_390]
MDVRAAFDTIDQDKLLKILGHILQHVGLLKMLSPVSLLTYPRTGIVPNLPAPTNCSECWKTQEDIPHECFG